MPRRDDIIDGMKGIGILCVVFGHSFANDEGVLRQFLFSFHMPLFFFLSGVLFHKNDGVLRPLVKFVSLYMFFVIVALLKFLVFPGSFVNSISSWRMGLWSVFVNGQPWFNAPLWFLVVSCLTAVLFCAFLSLTERLERNLRIIVYVVFFIAMMLISVHLDSVPIEFRNSIVPLKMTCLPATLVYFGSGHFGSELFKALEKAEFALVVDILILLLLISGIILSLPVIGQVNYRLAQISSIFVFPVAVMGILMVFFITRMAKASKFMWMFAGGGGSVYR